MSEQLEKSKFVEKDRPPAKPFKASVSSLEFNEERIIEEIRKLAEKGLTSKARKILSAIPPGVSAKIDGWRRVMAPPVAKSKKGGSGGNLEKSIPWLDKNSEAYRGQWVALKDGVLLGSHNRMTVLYDSLEKAGKLSGSLFCRL